jgi:hypothetical protein
MERFHVLYFALLGCTFLRVMQQFTHSNISTYIESLHFISIIGLKIKNVIKWVISDYQIFERNSLPNHLISLEMKIKKKAGIYAYVHKDESNFSMLLALPVSSSAEKRR